MNRQFLSVFLLFQLFECLFAANSYTAAIVEHEIYLGSSGDAASELLKVNLDIYESHVKLAKVKNSQVVVFPEFGLTAVNSTEVKREDLYPFATPIPETSAQVTPCGNANYDQNNILYRMSCAAKSNQILVLINTIDWINCAGQTSCPEDGHFQYNTDVLFDESGKIVAKYHKSHEWTPYIGAYDQVPEPSQVTYLSSFGVNFGLFICFDIMFPDPAKELRAAGISHFLYAVAQGDAGLKTIITDWSANQQATVLAANLGAGKKGDCSGILVNGKLLDTKKYYLGDSYPNENIIVGSVPF
jgi:pantetheine hydrolase